MDRVSSEVRSQMMARIRSRHTGPELQVRSYLHRSGLRFRVNRTDLPGSPDIVLPHHGSIVFVNGCFWHQHMGCRKARLPESNRTFWRKKLQRNVERDAEAAQELIKAGWSVHTIWECELNPERLGALVREIRRS